MPGFVGGKQDLKLLESLMAQDKDQFFLQLCFLSTWMTSSLCSESLVLDAMWAVYSVVL
jgi:hypothetical protein